MPPADHRDYTPVTRADLVRVLSAAGTSTDIVDIAYAFDAAISAVLQLDRQDRFTEEETAAEVTRALVQAMAAPPTESRPLVDAMRAMVAAPGVPPRDQISTNRDRVLTEVKAGMAAPVVALASGQHFTVDGARFRIDRDDRGGLVFHVLDIGPSGRRPAATVVPPTPATATVSTTIDSQDLREEAVATLSRADERRRADRDIAAELIRLGENGCSVCAERWAEAVARGEYVHAEPTFANTSDAGGARP